MLIKRIHTLLILSIIASVSFAQPTYFNKTYYLQDLDSAERGENISRGLIAQPDSTYLVYYFSYNFFTQYQNSVYSKINNHGDVITQNVLLDTGYTFGCGEIITSYDGNYYSCGNFLKQPIYDTVNYAFQKIDGNGNILWQQIGNPFIKKNCYLRSLTKTFDFKIAAVGQAWDSGASSQDLYFILCDSNGIKIKDTLIGGGTSWEGSQAIIQTPDSGFLLAGNKFITTYNGYLVKLDKNGTFQWQKIYGGAAGGGFEKMIALQDGNYLLMGSASAGADGDAWLVKVNVDGNVIWSKKYGVASINEDFMNAVELADSTIVIAGTTQDTTNGNNNFEAWIVKINAIGDTLWTRQYGHSTYPSITADVWLFEIVKTMDNGILVGGFADEAITGQNAWLLKLDSVGCDSVNCISGVGSAELNNETAFTLYPNPVQDEFTIQFKFTLYALCDIKVYNMLGELVYAKRSFIQKQTTIPTTALPPGMYFVSLNYEGQTVTRKFVKL